MVLNAFWKYYGKGYLNYTVLLMRISPRSLPWICQNTNRFGRSELVVNTPCFRQSLIVYLNVSKALTVEAINHSLLQSQILLRGPFGMHILVHLN